MRTFFWLTSVTLVAALLAVAALTDYADNHPSSVVGRSLVRMALAWNGTPATRPATDVVNQAELPEACANSENIPIIDIGPESDDTILRDLKTICELAREPELITVAPKIVGDADTPVTKPVDEFTPKTMTPVFDEETCTISGIDPNEFYVGSILIIRKKRTEFEDLLIRVNEHRGGLHDELVQSTSVKVGPDVTDGLEGVVAGHGPVTVQSTPTKPMPPVKDGLNDPDRLDNIILGPGSNGFISDLDIPINSDSFNLKKDCCPCNVFTGMMNYLGGWVNGFFRGDVEIEINVGANGPQVPPPCPTTAQPCPQGGGCQVDHQFQQPQTWTACPLDQQMMMLMAWPHGLPGNFQRIGIDFEMNAPYVTRTYETQCVPPMHVMPVTLLNPNGQLVTCYVQVPMPSIGCWHPNVCVPPASPVTQATFVPAPSCQQCPVPQPPVYSTPFGFDVYRPQPQACMPGQCQQWPAGAPLPFNFSTPPMTGPAYSQGDFITIAPCRVSPPTAQAPAPPMMAVQARVAAPCCEQSACAKALAKKISIEFDGKPLAEALNELREAAGINIVTDKPALEDAGIDMDQTVSMKLSDVPAWVALKRVLHNCRLAYKVEDDLIVVTTPKCVAVASPVTSGRMTTVVYPVKDLVGSEETFEMAECLLGILTSTVEPASWDQIGGDGWVDFYPLSQAFVVQQTPEVHKQVGRLLNQLREVMHSQGISGNTPPRPQFRPSAPYPGAPGVPPLPPYPPSPFGMVAPPPMPPSYGVMPPRPLQPFLAIPPATCERVPCPTPSTRAACSKTDCCKEGACEKCCHEDCCKEGRCAKCCCENESCESNVICAPHVQVALSDGTVMQIQVKVTKPTANRPDEFGVEGLPIGIRFGHPKDLPAAEIPDDLPASEFEELALPFDPATASSPEPPLAQLMNLAGRTKWAVLNWSAGILYHDPVRHSSELLVVSEDLKTIYDEWERVWYIDQPSRLTPNRGHGGHDEGCPYTGGAGRGYRSISQEPADANVVDLETLAKLACHAALCWPF